MRCPNSPLLKEAYGNAPFAGEVRDGLPSTSDVVLAYLTDQQPGETASFYTVAIPASFRLHCAMPVCHTPAAARCTRPQDEWA